MALKKTNEIKWIYYPLYDEAPEIVKKVARIFEKKSNMISSYRDDTNELRRSSDEILRIMLKDLESIGFKVEKGKKTIDKIKIPVLFGEKSIPKKTFDVDAYHEKYKMVIEIEAGRAVMNYQFLKDIFEACMMQEVEILGIAVRMQYRKTKHDYEEVKKFLDTLYASDRMKIPLNGILLIGY